ncbi:MAG: 1-deoxy-D-xylulose 5-phosphate reductoisomerase [Alphaproteobacteria bacterium MarineAlpha3_Bin4]|nr:MAG: 1-deoxy-D-xylulose 5-phosphate reductoisomerase [Alphaproteobacteria bacterium MarineAlpha3_Bin4]
MVVKPVSVFSQPRRVSILGSTGSVGANTVDLIKRQPDAFIVEALTANRNATRLAEQARELNARFAVVADLSKYTELKDALAGSNVEVAAGAEAILEAAGRPADWVMASIVGAAGLEPTLTAVRRGATVGLANKECLVSAGEIFIRELRASRATLLPVDSEHSAIFQVFDFDQPEKIERIILTASGGPFRELSLKEMETVTPEHAVAHPNWDMGAKISVDSATMMNKGLELIEAYHLFPVDKDKIEILVHPQSIIHSMVDYIDGSVLAQLGSPDMRTPIAYALAWPERMATPAPRLDLAEVGALSFEPPDPVRFPALRLAHEALQMGGAAPTLLNAANEVAVHSFLAGKLEFLGISRVVEKTLERASVRTIKDLTEVAAADSEARQIAEGLI